MTPAAALDRGLDALALDLPRDARERLMAYLALLGKWNRTYNLTAIRDPLKIVSHHLLDSLAVLPHLPSGETLADIGSGAGLPGIPIAIARPHLQVTLNDRNEKRVAFLRQSAIELGLDNVRVHAGRAEDWRPAEGFAIAITRAFAAIETFVATCRHLIAPGGALVAMKGAHPAREIDALGASARDCSVWRLDVPQLGAARHLVVLCPGSGGTVA